MVYVIIFFATLLLDQISKIIVDANNFNIPVIEGVFSINNHYNQGASFSFLADKDWAQTFFICLTVVVLVGLFIFLIISKIKSKWLMTTISLLVSGTIGNFIDRLAFGHVRDFLDVKFFANFNVADCCLTIGAIMLVVYILFIEEDSIIGSKKDKNECADDSSCAQGKDE